MEPISVVIPCLNEEHYIGKLLASLSRQTYQNFEVVIVDGGSTDRTADVISKFCTQHDDFGERVHFIVAEHKGVSYQRNLGAAQARFDRLLFLDADVQVKPHFLEQTLPEILTKKLELATVDFEPLSTRVDDKLLYSIASLYFKVLQLVDPKSMGWCIFSTKRVHGMLSGFDETYKLAEDFDYVDRAAKRGILLRVLTKGKVYISVRRLSDEGRLTYYKKAVLGEAYRFTHGHIHKELFPYEFGKFKEDVEAHKFASRQTKSQDAWNRMLDALKLTSDTSR